MFQFDSIEFDCFAHLQYFIVCLRADLLRLRAVLVVVRLINTRYDVCIIIIITLIFAESLLVSFNYVRIFLLD